MKHPLIIGAGGVASYLLPVLIKAFRPTEITIIDKDELEPRNLDRQLFDPSFVGRNKAAALIDTVLKWEPAPPRVTVLEEWFSDSTDLLDGDQPIDAVICVADNHLARLHALGLADHLGLRAYLGGNEYFDNEAYVYLPQWQGGKKDPRVRYPALLTEHGGSPIRCTGDAQASTPQLAIANLGCAAKLLHLLYVYERWVPDTRHTMDGVVFRRVFDSLPYQLQSSIYETGQLADELKS